MIDDRQQLEDLARDAVKNSKFHPPEKLLKPGDVAKWLGVSEGWVRDHATRKQPRLPVVRFGKVMRFRTADIEEFIRRWCQ